MSELTFAATESFPAVPPLSVFASPRQDGAGHWVCQSRAGLSINGENARDFGKMVPETGHFVENSPPIVNLTPKSSIWAV
jgi:hypothetical protein